VFALSGLGGNNDVSRVKRERCNKKFEKHWINSTFHNRNAMEERATLDWARWRLKERA